MSKTSSRRIRRKIDPAKSGKEEQKQPGFFGPENSTPFFQPAGHVQSGIQKSAEEEQVQMQGEKEEEKEKEIQKKEIGIDLQADGESSSEEREEEV